MYFAGSVLWLLCYQILQDTPEKNLEVVWKWLEAYWKVNPNPCRYNNMKLSMFTDPGQPRKKMVKLKGRGAEVKALIPALLWVWVNHVHVSGDPQHEAIKLGLFCSSRADEILDDHKEDFRLPDTKAQEFETNIWVFLLMQNALGLHFSELGEMLFDITPKSHYLAHIALFAKHLNPRLGWCYAGEDFMHTIKVLGSSAAVGNTASMAGCKLMRKYVYGLTLDVQRFEKGEYEPIED